MYQMLNVDNPVLTLFETFNTFLTTIQSDEIGLGKETLQKALSRYRILALFFTTATKIPAPVSATVITLNRKIY